MEDASRGVRCREDLPELLQDPRGGRMRRDIDVYEPAASRLHHDKDREPPERHSHRQADVAGPHGLALVADEGGPPMPGRATPSPAGGAGQVPTDGAGGASYPKLHEELCGDPLLAPRRKWGTGNGVALSVLSHSVPPQGCCRWARKAAGPGHAGGRGVGRPGRPPDAPPHHPTGAKRPRHRRTFPLSRPTQPATPHPMSGRSEDNTREPSRVSYHTHLLTA